MTEKKNTIYVDSLKMLDKSGILPGVEQVLKFLAEKKIKTAIGSSSKNARLILKYFAPSPR